VKQFCLEPDSWRAYRGSGALPFVVSLCCLFGCLEVATAGENGTLLNWDGSSVQGGPDLSKPLVTDRPDFTESSVTVGQGVLQLETGYTFTHDNEDGLRTNSHSFPESLLRVGMFADWFEFRVEWNYLIESTRAVQLAHTESGAEDLTLGMKIALTPQDQMLPETAIILQMSVPTGADAFSADQVLPGLNYCYGWSLTEDDDWTIGCSTAVNAATDDITTDNFTIFSQSFSLGHSWNERVSSYTEWYVLSPIGADTEGAQDYFNGGFTVLINNNVQWDIRAGVGLNESADDFFAGSGLSIRYF
jgi:hypothetical protein